MTLRVGLVGAGRQGRTLARALMNVAAARLVAVVDPEIGAATLLAGEYGPAGVAIHRAVRDSGSCGVQAWIVATPPSAHLTNLVELLRLDAPPAAVLCEKPAAWSLREVARMVHLARRSGVHLQFGLHLLYAMPASASSWLGAHGLGVPVSVAGAWHRRDGAPDWGHFRDTAGPGAAFDLGPHMLGVMMPVLLRHSPVRAVASTMTAPPVAPSPPDGPVHRDSSAEIRMFRRLPGDLGVAGDLSVAWSGRAVSPGLRIRITGTGGALTMRLDEERGDATVRVRLESRPAGASPLLGSWETPVHECYARQLAAFTDAARTGATGRVPPGAGAATAIASTRVIVAAYRSARTGGEVVSW